MHLELVGLGVVLKQVAVGLDSKKVIERHTYYLTKAWLGMLEREKLLQVHAGDAVVQAEIRFFTDEALLVFWLKTLEEGLSILCFLQLSIQVLKNRIVFRFDFLHPLEPDQPKRDSKKRPNMVFEEVWAIVSVDSWVEAGKYNQTVRVEKPRLPKQHEYAHSGINSLEEKDRVEKLAFVKLCRYRGRCSVELGQSKLLPNVNGKHGNTAQRKQERKYEAQ